MFITYSCSIEIQGFFSGYKKTMKRDPNLLKVIADSEGICEAKYSDSCKVLVLNGKDLQQCIKTEERTVIYLWSPHCTSRYCYGLDRLQQYMNDKGIVFYAVADYYDSRPMKAYYNLEYPIIGVDVTYYKSYTITSYLKKFLADLSINDTASARLFYLERGKFIRSFRELEEIQ